MQRVIIWGATGQAKVLNEALINSDFQIVAMVDNRKLPPPLPDIPLLLGEAELDIWLAQNRGNQSLYFLVAVGGHRGCDRLLLMNRLLERKLLPINVIHRTAFVADDAILGESCQVLAQAAVCTQTRLGRGVIVNTGASIDHDCKIGDGVHLAPGTRLAGEITVGARAFIGIGAIVLPRLHIGEDAVIGAGAVVTKNVPPNVTVVGNPARSLSRDP